MMSGPDKKKFDRVEKKCLIDSEQKARILKVLKKYMEKDEYYESEVWNIYFDTENFDLIQQSMEQPIFKEKLRARSYAGYDKVFLEIKTKFKEKEQNLGHKRRVRITKKDYEKLAKKEATVTELMKKNADGVNDYQIAREIDYLIEHFDLRPQILVIYRRESYLGENGLRITFDEDLKYRAESVNFRKNKRTKDFFENEKNIIMEIKARDAWPIWLARELSRERIFAKRFSKIGRIYEKIRKGEKMRKKIKVVEVENV